MKLEPAWIGELVGICAADDWAEVEQRLGHAAVSPMFRRLLPDLAESDESTGYSSAEVLACKAGIEWLMHAHPAEFQALSWEFHRWRRKTMARHEKHEELVQSAARLLADYVDRVCAG